VLQATVEPARLAHVIVVGNEKGGSGKTTIAMHLAVALIKAGQRVATIDLDSRQRSLTRYIENRRGWAMRRGLVPELPDHFCVARAEGVRVDENEAVEFAAFEQAAAAVEHDHDFIVIDTPPHDSAPMRLAHSITDTLVTPLNDGFLDLDVLATIDPVTFEVTAVSHYADMAREARRQRRLLDGTVSDWIVLRNRLSELGSRNRRRIGEALSELSARLGLRVADGFVERPVYRELFPRGLTALDDPDELARDADETETCSAAICSAARCEVEILVNALKLPIDERGRQRMRARAEWFVARDRPLTLDDILAI
jgi:chromosome partitioning protein